MKKLIFTLALLLTSLMVTAQSSDAIILPDTLGCHIDLDAPSRNVVTDYKMQSDPSKNQSSKLQAALDDMSRRGGGNLIIPEGEYCFSEVYMRSNVHLRVSSKATLRPYFYGGARGTIMLHFTPDVREAGEEYIENCSISCYDGDQFTVDYSDFNTEPAFSTHGETQKTMVRFICNRLVRNFLISDVHIKDNYTKYCGIIFVGARTPDVADKWRISRPTNGVVRNCSIQNVSHGYGLCQLHGADSILFDNIRANGGVTLRLEGHAGENVGVYNIFGHNIYNENGKAGVMFNPHVFHNGRVLIEGVKTNSTAFGVLIRPGFINRASQGDPNVELGTYLSTSHINNIHSVYGLSAQVESKDVWLYEPDQYEYIVMRERGNGCRQPEGASYAPVVDNTEGRYRVQLTNVTGEGFPTSLPEDGVIYTENLPRTAKNTWGIVKNIPVYQNNNKKK